MSKGPIYAIVVSDQEFWKLRGDILLDKYRAIHDGLCTGKYDLDFAELLSDERRHKNHGLPEHGCDCETWNDEFCVNFRNRVKAKRIAREEANAIKRAFVLCLEWRGGKGDSLARRSKLYK